MFEEVSDTAAIVTMAGLLSSHMEFRCTSNNSSMIRERDVLLCIVLFRSLR